jgi:hypothetical protein
MAAYLPATRMAAGVLVALCLPVHASGSSTRPARL